MKFRPEPSAKEISTAKSFPVGAKARCVYCGGPIEKVYPSADDYALGWRHIWLETEMHAHCRDGEVSLAMPSSTTEV